MVVMSLQNSLLRNAVPLTHHPSGIVAGLNGGSNLWRCRRVAMQRRLVTLVFAPNIAKIDAL
jgi:hypothetical protein